jgi:hypothetical protein
LLIAAVIPTIHDVVGAPVPGVPGLRPAPSPSDPARFRELLHQLLQSSGDAPTAARVPQAPATKASGAVLRRHVPVHAATSMLRATHTPVSIPRTLHAPVSAPRTVHVPTAPHARQTAPHGASAAPAAANRKALASAIRQAAATAGVEPALSVGVARVESNLNPAARSPDGVSHGTFQVTHATAAEMRRRFATGAVARPAGTEDVALGVGYLRYLHDLFARPASLGRGVATTPVADAHERRLFAVAAFNAGEGRVAVAQAHARAAGHDPTRFADVRPYLPPITRTYVERVSTFAREEAGATQAA